jgi:hypothetical protein
MVDRAALVEKLHTALKAGPEVAPVGGDSTLDPAKEAAEQLGQQPRRPVNGGPELCSSKLDLSEVGPVIRERRG